jgi:hypothetical protein
MPAVFIFQRALEENLEEVVEKEESLRALSGALIVLKYSLGFSGGATDRGATSFSRAL